MTFEHDENAPPVNPRPILPEYEGRKGIVVDDYRALNEMGFFAQVHEAVIKTQVRYSEEAANLSPALQRLRELAKETHSNGKKVIFIGNGGSSAISSHMAVDWTKNGDIRSVAFNDAPTLTCLANDFGYEEVFSKQLEFYASSGDLVIIISSSGKSPNILKAAEQAFIQGLSLVTFSGMRPNNVLRKKGLISFYVPALDYGIVELSHLTLLHSIVSVPFHKDSE